MPPKGGDYTLAHGPLGLEATHAWEPAVGPSISLNLAAIGPDVGEDKELPGTKLDKIVGLYSLGDADDFRAPRLGAMGDMIYPSYSRGKTISYEGRVIAENWRDLRDHMDDLRAAFGHRDREGVMTIKPCLSWQDDPATIRICFDARVITFQMDEEQTLGYKHPLPLQRHFVIGLRLSDPRFYYPVEEHESANEGDTVTVTNLGTAPADPQITIQDCSDGGDVTIDKDGDRQLLFDFPAGVSGNLEIDFRNRTAEVGGEDALGHLDVNSSDWWDELVTGVDPGDTDVSVNGDCGDWDIWWKHSWW